jgi:hypothetical protein
MFGSSTPSVASASTIGLGRELPASPSNDIATSRSAAPISSRSPSPTNHIVARGNTEAKVRTIDWRFSGLMSYVCAH